MGGRSPSAAGVRRWARPPDSRRRIAREAPSSEEAGRPEPRPGRRSPAPRERARSSPPAHPPRGASLGARHVPVRRRSTLGGARSCQRRAGSPSSPLGAEGLTRRSPRSARSPDHGITRGRPLLHGRHNSKPGRLKAYTHPGLPFPGQARTKELGDERVHRSSLACRGSLQPSVQILTDARDELSHDQMIALRLASAITLPRVPAIRTWMRWKVPCTAKGAGTSSVFACFARGGEGSRTPVFE